MAAAVVRVVRLDRRAPMITQPTLLIWGAADRVMPRAYADQWKRAIPGGATLRVIPDAGHLAELDQPAAVARAVLDFTN